MGGSFLVSVPGWGVSFVCGPGETVLAAMRRAALFPSLWGCRGGGCGVCKVRVLSGTVSRGPVSRAHVTRAQEAQGYALACKIKPESDLELQIQVNSLAFGGDG